MIRRTLRFSIGGNAFRVSVCAAFVAAAGVMSANLWLHPTSGDPSRLGLLGPRGFAIVMALCGVYFLWFGAFSLWRLFVDAPALELHDAFLGTHWSFIRVPRVIPISSIADAVFDRADRVRPQYGTIEKAVLVGGRALDPASGGAVGGAWGARQSAKCRTVMQIGYSDEQGQPRTLRLLDNQISGGKWALARFTRDLRKRLGKSGLGRRQNECTT